MQELKLTITIDEANLILDALGNQPFHKVFAFIGGIQQIIQTSFSIELFDLLRNKEHIHTNQHLLS